MEGCGRWGDEGALGYDRTYTGQTGCFFGTRLKDHRNKVRRQTKFLLRNPSYAHELHVQLANCTQGIAIGGQGVNQLMQVVQHYRAMNLQF